MMCVSTIWPLKLICGFLTFLQEIRSPATDDPDDDLDGIKAKKSRLINTPEILSSLPLSTTVRSLTIPAHPAGFCKPPPTVGPFSPVDHAGKCTLLFPVTHRQWTLREPSYTHSHESEIMRQDGEDRVIDTLLLGGNGLANVWVH